MKALVTGGCGFIGSHLVDDLLKDGFRVTVVDDLSSGVEKNLNPNAQFLRGDINDRALIDRALTDVDACFHLAAKPSVQLSFDELAISHRANLSGFVTVLNAVLDHSRRVKESIPLIFTSSAAVYGDNSNLPLSEVEVPRPMSPYAVDKFACEMHAAVMAQQFQMATVGLRPFNVYGRRQLASSPYCGVITKIIDAIRDKRVFQMFGDGKQTRDYIHVSDVVRAFRAAMNFAKPGQAPVINLGTGREISLLDLITQLSDLLGTKPELKHAPARPGEIFRSVANITRLKNDLGIKNPIDLKTGLRETLELH